MPRKQLLSPRRIAEFRRTIRQHYELHGRTMPWRETDDPYEILVSEIMLQQTQVERVVPKYRKFLDRFPDLVSLAGANLRDLLAIWQGLGYNRRALALQQAARIILERFNGQVPNTTEDLTTLPGIGKATAGSLLAFVFEKPVVFVETNIRRVYIHSFFPDRTEVKDREITPLVAETLDRDRVRSWYYALMDYGAMLKGKEPNPNQRSAHYHRQSPFQNSDRQIRGQILRALIATPHMTPDELTASIGKSPERVRKILGDLLREGFLVRAGNKVKISSGFR